MNSTHSSSAVCSADGPLLPPGIPLTYSLVLWKRRAQLNPLAKETLTDTEMLLINVGTLDPRGEMDEHEELERALEIRHNDRNIKNLKFLYDMYKPACKSPCTRSFFPAAS